MMKTIIIGIISIMIVSSCGTYKESFRNLNENRGVKFDDGTIIYDNSGNAVYIPENLEQKDLVYLTSIKKGDSIEFKSNFSREHVNISYNYSGEAVAQDSVIVRLVGEYGYPIGLVRVDFFKDQAKVSSYSPLGGHKSAYVYGVTGFIVDVFGAKSDFIKLNRNELKNTLIITFDYLIPSEIEKYTFIDFTIPTPIATPTKTKNKPPIKN